MNVLMRGGCSGLVYVILVWVATILTCDLIHSDSFFFSVIAESSP